MISGRLASINQFLSCFFQCRYDFARAQLAASEIQPGPAQDFYKDKIIRFIVGQAPVVATILTHAR